MWLFLARLPELTLDLVLGRGLTRSSSFPCCSEGDWPSQTEKRKERSAKRGGGSRFEPYPSPSSKRYRAFITNIPFDVKWQYLKDLVKEKGTRLGRDCRTSALLPRDLFFSFIQQTRNGSEVVWVAVAMLSTEGFLRAGASGVACWLAAVPWQDTSLVCRCLARKRL